jgi:hypothetical protein
VVVLTHAVSGNRVNRDVRRWALERFAGIRERDPQPDPSVNVDPAVLAGRYLSPFAILTLTPGDAGTVTVTFTERDDVDGWKPPAGPPAKMGFAKPDQAVTLDMPEGNTLVPFKVGSGGVADWVQWDSRRSPRIGCPRSRSPRPRVSTAWREPGARLARPSSGDFRPWCPPPRRRSLGSSKDRAEVCPMSADEEPFSPSNGDRIPASERDAARKHLQAKRWLKELLVAFVLVNAVLVLVWGLTGRGYFWPGWVMGIWAAGLVLQAWITYFRHPITNADVSKELGHRR